MLDEAQFLQERVREWRAEASIASDKMRPVYERLAAHYAALAKDRANHQEDDDQSLHSCQVVRAPV
jgi:hypothetical protein